MIGAYATKEEKLKKYLNRVLEIRDDFTYFKLEQVSRADNAIANRLAKASFAKDDMELLWEVHKKVIEVPAIGNHVNHVGPSGPEWAKEILEYLEVGKLPEGKQASRKARMNVARFIRID